jgi:hypothetical protein
MTEFRRRLRFHQATWREANGHPIGSQPIAPRPVDTNVRPVGSRMPLRYARETGANFLNAPALAAVQSRSSFVERHQMFDSQRLWADLLWSPALCFNLFGDLAADLALAGRAVHRWWPDAPGAVSAVRFAHSPGRLDPSYLGNLVAWDVAFVLDLDDGTRGLLSAATKYADHVYRQAPKPARLPRYVEVSEGSGAFAPGWLDAVNGTDLIHIWLDHALMLSMLQQTSGTWSWGRFVVVYPADNCNFADACSRYRELLHDDSTFATMTVEEILDSGSLPATTAAAIRQRYVPAGG